MKNLTDRTVPTSETPPFRLGVVGAGKISQIILPMLAARGIRVAGLTDVSAEAAGELAAKIGDVPVYPDAAELFRAGGMDGVYLATPPATHRVLILQCLQAGFPVLCEKPWVMNAEEARELVAETAAYRATGLTVAACSSRFRFTPAATALVDALAEGKIGSPRHVRMIARVSPPPPLENLPEWKRHTSTAGGGISSDWCVYELDWLAAVLGPAFDPIEVSADFDDWLREGSGLDSGYDVRMRCASGLTVRIRRLAEIGPREHKVEISGTAGTIELPFAPDAADPVARLHQPGAEGAPHQTGDLAPAVTDWSAILCGPFDNFVAAVRQGTPVASSPESQVLVHTLLDAIMTSAREKRPVPLEKI